MKTLPFDPGARLQAVYTPYVEATPSLELKTAMGYTLQHNGKYLRPLLIYATGSLFDAALEDLDVPASAVELIHTYSLIHDDLPCMDNADLRRGKAACHKMYGDGMAVLTGDALHTLALQILACHPASIKPARRLQMLQVLAKACGPYGMAAGQALDLAVMGDKMLSGELLLDIYHLKTGALFTACIELGRLASRDEDDANQRALIEFGNCIGLAFQIQDDILDIEASTQALGKPQGIDVKNQKITYPQVVGMQSAKDKVQTLYQEALEAIDYFGDQARLLRELAGKILQKR